MTHEDRIKYSKAINVITYKIIDRPYDENVPTNEQLEAMRLAIHAMNMMAYDTGRSMTRLIAILNYHLENPNALLFRDKHTMEAMKTGVAAMRYLMNDKGAMHFITADLGNVCGSKSEYGKRWRAWASPPTSKERKETEWRKG